MTTKQSIREELKCKSIEAALFLKLSKNGFKIELLLEKYKENYLTNKSVMENNDIYFEKYFATYSEEEDRIETRIRLENFYNDCAKVKIKHLSKQLISCISNKKDLFNETTLTLFNTMAELNVQPDFIKENVSKKINTLHTTELLNNALQSHISNIQNWDLENQMAKINFNNGNIIHSEDNKIFFEINDFEASKNLGSPMWCIQRDEEDFNRYREDANRIIVCYDFNKSPSNNESRIAYIVTPLGEIDTAYLNNDDIIEDDNDLINNLKFNKYTQSEIFDRFEDSYISDGKRILILIKNQFNEEVQDMLSNIDSFNITYEELSKFLVSKNKEFIHEIIQDYPKLLIEGGSTEGELLTQVLNYGYISNYSEDGAELISAVLNNNDFINILINHNGEFMQEPLQNIAFSAKNGQEQLNSLLKNNNFNIYHELSKLEKNCINNELLNLLKSVDEEGNYKNYIKSNLPEVAYQFALSYNNKKAFEYLEINKDKDKNLIEYLVKQVNKNKKSISDTILIEIQKQLSQLTENGIDVIKDILKSNIINSPRRLSSLKQEVKDFNIILSESETMDLLSQLVFERKFSTLKNTHTLDLQEDLTFFNIPLVLQRNIFNSDIVNLDGKAKFINYLQQYKGFSEAIDLKVSNIESFSVTDFLTKKESHCKNNNPLNSITKPKI